MASTAILAVRIISDAKGASAGLDQTSSKLGKLGQAAKAGGVALAAGIGAGMLSAVKSAANLQQSIGAVDTVFGKSAGQMHTWAKGAATDVGLTRNEFNELGTLIGSQLKNGGTAMDQLAPKTRNLIKTGADLSSMFGGTTKEAVEALSSALKGERDPIEKYGVSLNQAKIDAEAASLGFKKVDGALSSQAQQAATLSLIMKQTSDAQGNFARESGTLAHQQQVLGARLGNLKDTIGTALLPVVTSAVGTLSTFVGQMQSGTGTGGRLVAVLTSVKNNLGTIAPALGVVAAGLTIYKIASLAAAAASAIQAAGTTAATGATWSLNAALRANPLGIVVTLLTALGVGLVVAYKKSETFRNIVNGAWNAVRNVAGSVLRFLSTTVPRTFSAIAGAVSDGMGRVRDFVSDGIDRVRSSWSSGWDKVKTTLTAAWRSLTSGVSDGIGDVVAKVRDLPGKITGAIGNLGSLLVNAGRSILDGLISGITDRIGALQSKLSSVTNLIPDWKGPATKDARLLRPAGELIIGGLIDGIDRSLPALRRTLTGVTREVAGTSFTTAPVAIAAHAGSSRRTAGAGRPVTVNVNFNGVVGDPQAAARQIIRTINNYAYLTGTPR